MASIVTKLSDEPTIRAIAQELEGATLNYPPFKSLHEGYAIILEELDELKEEIWKKPSKRDEKHLRKEAIQVAAMAARFVRDLC